MVERWELPGDFALCRIESLKQTTGASLCQEQVGVPVLQARVECFHLTDLSELK